jgi:predicted metal-dependent phosphoesterase TrpH
MRIACGTSAPHVNLRRTKREVHERGTVVQHFALSSTDSLVILFSNKEEDETMEHEPQATIRQSARHAARALSANTVEAPAGPPRPYATLTAQIARMVAVVAIEVALQQAFGPLFQLRRS